MTTTVTFVQKKLVFVAAGGIRVSQTRFFFISRQYG